MGKGGDSTTSTTTSELGKFSEPYFKDVIKRGQAMSMQGYTPYQGQRLANFSNDTNQAFNMIRSQAGQGVGGLAGAQNIAAGVGGFQPGTIRSTNVASQDVNSQDVGIRNTTAQNVTSQNVGMQNVTSGNVNARDVAMREIASGNVNARDVGLQNVTSGNVNSRDVNIGNVNARDAQTRDVYSQNVSGGNNFRPVGIGAADLNPYMNQFTRNVLDVNKDMASRRFQEQQTMRDTDAIRAGAFGGSRRFVSDSLAQRDMNEQLDSMNAEGLSAAFDRATGLFQNDQQLRFDAHSTDSARQLQAGISNADRRFNADVGNAERFTNVSVGNADRRFSADNANIDRQMQVGLANADRRFNADVGNMDRRLTADVGNAERFMQTGISNSDRRLNADVGNMDRRLSADKDNAARFLQTGISNSDRRLTADTSNRDSRLDADQDNAARYMQTNISNADRRYNADVGNSDRRYNSDRDNADRYMQTGISNADRRLDAQTGNATRRLNANVGNADRGLQAGIANEEARRLAGGLRLDAADSSANMAQQWQDMGLRNAEALSTVGSKIQQRDQAGKDMAYGDFQSQRDDQRQKLSWYASMLAGQPINPDSSTTESKAPPDFLSQLLGLATAGIGAFT